MPLPQIIVSGATGFIGHHLVPLFLDRSYDVVALGRDENKARECDWFGKVDFISCDYHRAILPFKPRPDSWLIHLAWQGLPNYMSPIHFEETLPKNYQFLKHMVSEGVSKILVAGTCFEYGFKYGPLSVGTPTDPANSYALAKDCLRKYLVQLQAELPFIFQWARLFYMYGRGQNPKSILAQLDAAIDSGAPTFNMSGGEQLRDYLPVEDVARQLVALAEENETGIFNVCSGKPVSIRRLVEDRIKERKSSIQMNLGHYPYPDHEPMAFWGECTKLESRS